MMILKKQYYIIIPLKINKYKQKNQNKKNIQINIKYVHNNKNLCNFNC